MSTAIALGSGEATLRLLDELLEASADTIELIDGHDLGLRWAAHVQYLGALYRRGQELLAGQAQAQSSASPGAHGLSSKRRDVAAQGTAE